MLKSGLGLLLAGLLALLVLVACQPAITTATATAVTNGAAAAGSTAARNDGSTTVSVASALAENGAAEDVAEATVALPGTPDVTAVAIVLNGDSISAGSEAVTVSGRVATITAAGSYQISGSLADGQIVVDAADADVQLILNGITISSSTSAPIAILDAGQVTVMLADASANTLTDASTYVFPDPEEDEPNAALFSNADLTIGGNGSLAVTGNYNDAISSDDGLIITGGTITATAADDGIRGKDYVVVQGGNLTVTAGGDGLKSDNEDDATLGYISIAGGDIAIGAGGDAIAAQTDVLIAGGKFTLVAGNGSSSQIAAGASAKGVKGLASVIIDGGTFAIDTADDGIHSNAAITINGGVFRIASGDDGIHSDAMLTVNGGEIEIATSYEGLESAVITINAGDIRLAASDDGVNVAGGADGSGTMGGPGRGGPRARQSGETFNYSGTQYLYINGGTTVVYAGGDGIDVNGAIEMTGGVVVVHGPTENMNGALDYDGGFKISGGLFVAAGSAGMAQTADSSSTQNAVLVNFSGMVEGGTLIHIQNSAGEEVLTFAPMKAYASLAYSSAALANGERYTVYLGGSSTGAAVDGLYTGGSYTPGTEYGRFTVTSVMTMLGDQLR